MAMERPGGKHVGKADTEARQGGRGNETLG
jgi:hypothetical protein